MTERASDERLTEMLAACEGVTPGPWKRQPKVPYVYRYAGPYPGDSYGGVEVAECGNWKDTELVPFNMTRWMADAAHIANCDPQTICSIITELLELRKAASPAPADSGAVAWMKDVGGNESDLGPAYDECLVVAAKGDPGAFPVYTHPAPSPSMGRVTVKALEWRNEPGGVLRATTTIGDYIINQLGEWWGPQTSQRGGGRNFAGAKAAAQADYEARIRSALSLQQGEVEPVAWEGYWPGAGSINSSTAFTQHRATMERWKSDGAEITPLYALPTPQHGSEP